jgi:hypothetical protein
MSCDELACFQVLLVLTEFYSGKMTKEEARSLMDGLLPVVPLPYVPEAQVIVDRIYEETAVPDEVVEQATEPKTESIEDSESVEVAPNEDTVQEEQEHPKEEEIPFSEPSHESEDDIEEIEQDEYMK